MTDLTHAAIDQEAQRVASAAVSGQLPGPAARARLAELVHESRIATEISWYPHFLTEQARLDIAESVSGMLTEWVLNEGDPFFDLNRSASGSLCGWARQAGLMIVRRHDAVRPRRLVRDTALVSPLAPDTRVLTMGDNGSDASNTNRQYMTYHLSQAFGGATSEDLALAEMTSGVREADQAEVILAARGQRIESRPFAISGALRRSLSLPSLCVPSDNADRQFVLDACEADPLLAARSVRTMLDILEDPQLGRSQTDERLLSLWDDFSTADLRKLEPYPPSAVHLIVVGALTAAPKMSRLALRTMTRLVKERQGKQTRPWHALVNRLVASYLARRTNAVSEFDDTSDEMTKAAMRRAAVIDAEAWPQVLAEAIAFPGSPLGTDATTVEEELAHAMILAWDQDVSVRTSRSKVPAPVW